MRDSTETTGIPRRFGMLPTFAFLRLFMFEVAICDLKIIPGRGVSDLGRGINIYSGGSALGLPLEAFGAGMVIFLGYVTLTSV